MAGVEARGVEAREQRRRRMGRRDGEEGMWHGLRRRHRYWHWHCAPHPADEGWP